MTALLVGAAVAVTGAAAFAIWAFADAKALNNAINEQSDCTGAIEGGQVFHNDNAGAA